MSDECLVTVAPQSRSCQNLAFNRPCVRIHTRLGMQVSYMILARVTPVTHSIGNCLKRVIVIVASVIFFQNPMSQQNMLGKPDVTHRDPKDALTAVSDAAVVWSDIVLCSWPLS